MAMQITSDTDFQKPSFHIKNSDIALRNLIEKKTRFTSSIFLTFLIDIVSTSLSPSSFSLFLFTARVHILRVCEILAH